MRHLTAIIFSLLLSFFAVGHVHAAGSGSFSVMIIDNGATGNHQPFNPAEKRVFFDNSKVEVTSAKVSYAKNTIVVTNLDPTKTYKLYVKKDDFDSPGEIRPLKNGYVVMAERTAVNTYNVLTTRGPAPSATTAKTAGGSGGTTGTTGSAGGSGGTTGTTGGAGTTASGLSGTANVELGLPIPTIEGSKTSVKDYKDYLTILFKGAEVVASILAVVMIIYGGFRYMLSEGDAGKTTEAKEIIVGALTGIALLILSNTLLQFLFTSLPNGGAK